ncbi:hypothetical protein ACFQ1L_01270 [Phytohabitans flavus]|uniref:hypothetical protein n=1 Tax=Phytohabitans flavus TaxID=1076124 RepID=UPI00363F1DBF
MAPSPGKPDDLFYDARNTARPTRARFRYQDECVALRCIHNLLSEEVHAVVVEWSTDYVAVPRDGVPELVSIKHRDPGQGEWQMSQLREVVRDLHMVWREEGERCRCAFASNAAISSDAATKLAHKLGDYIDADVDEVARFQRVLAMPDPPLPRRAEITAVGVRDMEGALSLLDRDPRYAEECYRTLVNRIGAVATEEPPTPEERIGRLTGTLRMVTERSAPRLEEQTLLIGDLRDLVLRTHAEYAGRMPRLLHARAPSVREPIREDERWQGRRGSARHRSVPRPRTGAGE